MAASEWNAIPNTSGTPRHKQVKDQLRSILTRRVRGRRAGHGLVVSTGILVVSTGIEVRLAPDLRRRPDLLISYRADPDHGGDER